MRRSIWIGQGADSDEEGTKDGGGEMDRQGVDSDEEGTKDGGGANGLGRVLTVMKRGQRMEEEQMDWAGC